jgi:hypothetical protein
LLLALFHFFIENRLEPRQGSELDVEKTLSVLRIIPRIGMGVLVLIVLLMMFAARGL